MNTQNAINRLQDGIYGASERIAIKQAGTLFYSDRATVVVTEEPVQSPPCESDIDAARLACKVKTFLSAQAEPMVVEVFHIDRLRNALDAVTSEALEDKDVVLRIIETESGHIFELSNAKTSVAVMSLKLNDEMQPRVYPSVRKRASVIDTAVNALAASVEAKEKEMNESAGRILIEPQPEPIANSDGAWWYNEEPYMSNDAMASHLFHNVYGDRLGNSTVFAECYPVLIDGDWYWQE